MLVSPRRKAYLALAMGVFIVSWAAILIRWAGEAPALIISAGRLVVASLILTPIALLRGATEELQRLKRRDLLLLLLAGAALAAHFASWITSLRLTTVASSVVLVTTHPLFVGLASHFVLQERISRLTALGIALAVVGSGLVGYGDFGLSREALIGDILAVVGALTVAIYFLVGRRLRQQLSIVAYIWPVYGLAAILLLALCGLMGLPFRGYQIETYGMIVLIALGPQLLGHSSLNYALQQLSAIFVTISVLIEPLGSAALALLLLDEIPPPATIIGGALILGGIAMAAREEENRAQ